jgi:TolA-binding protein
MANTSTGNGGWFIKDTSNAYQITLLKNNSHSASSKEPTVSTAVHGNNNVDLVANQEAVAAMEGKLADLRKDQEKNNIYLHTATARAVREEKRNEELEKRTEVLRTDYEEKIQQLRSENVRLEKLNSSASAAVEELQHVKLRYDTLVADVRVAAHTSKTNPANAALETMMYENIIETNKNQGYVITDLNTKVTKLTDELKQLCAWRSEEGMEVVLLRTRNGEMANQVKKAEERETKFDTAQSDVRRLEERLRMKNEQLKKNEYDLQVLETNNRFLQEKVGEMKPVYDKYITTATAVRVGKEGEDWLIERLRDVVGSIAEITAVSHTNHSGDIKVVVGDKVVVVESKHSEQNVLPVFSETFFNQTKSDMESTGADVGMVVYTGPPKLGDLNVRVKDNIVIVCNARQGSNLLLGIAEMLYLVRVCKGKEEEDDEGVHFTAIETTNLRNVFHQLCFLHGNVGDGIEDARINLMGTVKKLNDGRGYIQEMIDEMRTTATERIIGAANLDDMKIKGHARVYSAQNKKRKQ